MDVEASCFKDRPQVFTCAVDRHVANEYFGRLPEQDCCCFWRRFLQGLTIWRVRLWAASPCMPAHLASSQLAERSDNIWLFKVVQGCSRLFKVGGELWWWCQPGSPTCGQTQMACLWACRTLWSLHTSQRNTQAVIVNILHVCIRIFSHWLKSVWRSSLVHSSVRLPTKIFTIL